RRAAERVGIHEVAQVGAEVPDPSVCELVVLVQLLDDGGDDLADAVRLRIRGLGLGESALARFEVPADPALVRGLQTRLTCVPLLLRVHALRGRVDAFARAAVAGAVKPGVDARAAAARAGLLRVALAVNEPDG